MPAWEYVVVHHSLTKDGATVSWDAIRKYHVETLGDHDIGYHFGIEYINERAEVLRGRPLAEAGAHTREAHMNTRGIGVCIVGNFDLETPDDARWLLAASLVRDLQGAFKIPRARVIGHREAGLLAGFDWRKGQYKTCPGAKWDMAGFRDAVSA